MTAKNKKLNTNTKAHRFGAFTRNATIGKAKWLGSITAKAARAVKNTAVEFKDGFVEEAKS